MSKKKKNKNNLQQYTKQISNETIREVNVTNASDESFTMYTNPGLNSYQENDPMNLVGREFDLIDENDSELTNNALSLRVNKFDDFKMDIFRKTKELRFRVNSLDSDHIMGKIDDERYKDEKNQIIKEIMELEYKIGGPALDSNMDDYIPNQDILNEIAAVFA